jgi:Lecithin:cholesterol acyltransferase
LLREIGEHSLAGAYDQVHALSGLLAAGPLPGVRTFCIYGAGADTPRSWVYTAPLGPPARGMAAAELPRVDAVGKGDGVVGLESLRLCGRLTSSPADVFELEGVSHTSVYTRRVAFKAIKRALEALGVTGG